MVSPLLGVMELQPNTFEWKHILPTAGTEAQPGYDGLLVFWLQDAGGFAALGLALWFIYVLLTPAPAVAGSRRKMISKFMAICAAFALVAYLIAAGLTYAIRESEKDRISELGLTVEQVKEQEKQKGVQLNFSDEKLVKWQGRVLAGAGFLALLAFCEPFFLDFARLRWRRIFAISKLSFKEAVRRKVPWVFLLMLLVFLFPARWFFSKQVKPEDDLKTTISVISIAMTVTFILPALLLSGFSIPTDVKNQTIHTIVTKPVERFEIVVGRFLGYVLLITLALIVVVGASVLMILSSNIDPAAREESMKARVPVYGVLDFLKERQGANKQLERQAFAGIDVGREYSYRKYIAGHSEGSHRAIWNFLDAGDLKPLAAREAVTMEFAFDVYRTTKGEENKGVSCSFDVVTWKWDPALEDEYNKAIGGARSAKLTETQRWKTANEVAEKFGRFEFNGVQVYDYHTNRLDLPPGLFKNALNGTMGKDSPLQSSQGPALIQIKARCTTPSQLVGVAPLDLYLLESDGVFWLNFFKSAVGLWCRLCLVIGLAVAASTYLAGVVAFVAAFFLFLLGYFLDFIRSLAAGVNAGGGPFESFTRLVKGSTVAGELDQTPSTQVALFGDDVFRWMLRRVINVIPDTERFTWSNYLAQGFSIEPQFIGLNLLFLVAYMLPWAVLAYYLMRSREIAA
jgi:ABC-type transport system involved in multi-copper enzyme maturation permease subunit